jgi:hypothetical protein
MSTQQKKVYIEEYSTKSFVVCGYTRPHKETIKAMGGKWMNRLTDKKTGEKFGAWLFWTSKFPEVNTWIKEGCKPIERSELQTVETNHNKQSQIESRLTAIEATLVNLDKMVQNIYKCLKNSDIFIDAEVIINDEKEDKTPFKRLLR